MNNEVPKKNKKDRQHALKKAGLSAIPWVGGSLAVLLDEIVKPSIEKRRDEFFHELNKRLQKLEDDKKVDLKKLKDNEELVDIVIKAMKSAISTRQEVKKEALLNAILNTSLGKNPQENQTDMFINWIDSFTEWHIKLLYLFNNPEKFIEDNQNFSNLLSFIESTYPELNGKREFCEQLCRTLNSRGLLQITENMLITGMTSSGITTKRSTKMGDSFIQFISSPD